MPSDHTKDQNLKGGVGEQDCETDRKFDWRCQRCRYEIAGNPRMCPSCGYTVYDRWTPPAGTGKKPHPQLVSELQRFRYEAGQLDYEPRDSAPEGWDGNLNDLIGDYFRAEDVEALSPQLVSVSLEEAKQKIQAALDTARELAERVNQELDDYPAYSSAEDAIQEAEATLNQPVPGMGHCDQCEQPKAGTVALGEEGEEELCAPCLLVRLLEVLKPAEGHDFKIADACPMCQQPVPGDGNSSSEVGEDVARLLIAGGPEDGRLPDPDCTDLFDRGLLKHVAVGYTGEYEAQLTPQGYAFIAQFVANSRIDADPPTIEPPASTQQAVPGNGEGSGVDVARLRRRVEKLPRLEFGADPDHPGFTQLEPRDDGRFLNRDEVLAALTQPAVSEVPGDAVTDDDWKDPAEVEAFVAAATGEDAATETNLRWLIERCPECRHTAIGKYDTFVHKADCSRPPLEGIIVVPEREVPGNSDGVESIAQLLAERNYNLRLGESGSRAHPWANLSPDEKERCVAMERPFACCLVATLAQQPPSPPVEEKAISYLVEVSGRMQVRAENAAAAEERVAQGSARWVSPPQVVSVVRDPLQRLVWDDPDA